MALNDMKSWMDYKGKKFLEDIGLVEDQFVLDFGCGHGTYTIPASLVVGEKGKVYAVDKNKEVLNELFLKAKEKELKNIKIIELVNKFKLPLPKRSVDMVLLYDVLHLLESRKRLLTELRDVLKYHGILSVYPKHHQKYMNMDLEGAREEIESVGYHFDVKLFKKLMHDDQFEKGYVLNFKKI